MPFAVLTEKLPSGPSVKREEGVIEGCKLCEAGKLAVFKGPDGKPVQILMRPEVVDKLLALWSAESEGAAHWTHRWIETGEDGLESKVATWKNFRKDDSGNLIADAHLWETPRKETILSAAEKDPKGIMVSQVFDYSGGRDDCVPLSVFAADFVEKGAATTSLRSMIAKLSATQKAHMAEITLDDLKTLFATPEGKAMVQGCIDGHDKAADMADDDMATMESESGVKDEDKKDEPAEDKQEPALMKVYRFVRRTNRALNRRLKEVAQNEAAILAKAKVQWEAEFAGQLGKNKAVLSGFSQTQTEELAVTKAIRTQVAAGARRPKAILRALNDAKPEDRAAFESAGRPMPV